MNQEIQLSVNPSLPVPANPAGTSLLFNGSQQHGPETALQLVHRLLRGRYGVALVLATMFAAAGATAGFLLPRTSFQSVGLLEIKPVTPTIDNWERVMPMYNYYVASVVQKIKSERVIKGAMEDATVLSFRPNTPETLAEITKGLNAKYIANTSLVQVTFESDAKDAKRFAPPVVSAIIHAYEDRLREFDEAEFQNRMDMRKSSQTRLESEVTNLQQEIDRLTANIGDDPQLAIQARMHEIQELRPQAMLAQEALEAAESELKHAEAQNRAATYSVDDLARVDPMLAAKVAKKTELEGQLALMQLKFGPNHPQYKAIQQLIDTSGREVDDLVKKLNTNYFIKQRADGTGGVLIPRNLDNLRETRDRKNAAIAQLEKEIRELQTVSTKVAENHRRLLKRQDELAVLKKKSDDMITTHEMGKTFNVVDYGGQAVVASDKRIALSAVGFLAGGGIPIGLMLLAGLMNPRVRFSDETSHEINGLTLLGILPDLPDRLSDPEQASIAAHCVHQIRTMLQINNHTQDRRVFAVTSAAPGDGKTSLTLALGLSYAACGTRTLLIDCDIVGAGLTTRMNVNVPEGVLEAIANRSLLEYVRTTDVADVAILPVGTAQGLHASTLSPAALRRLVDEAKKHFDTILIDTGPILGSIEASLVCAAADAVVLTVSRGQQRPLVEKAISHLTSIGARLAGVVFNRAQAADFERSISGMSVRSNPAVHGGRIGPVARAVQSSFKGGSPQ